MTKFLRSYFILCLFFKSVSCSKCQLLSLKEDLFFDWTYWLYHTIINSVFFFLIYISLFERCQFIVVVHNFLNPAPAMYSC